MNLKQYAMIYPSYFTQHECDRITQFSQRYEEVNAGIGQKGDDPDEERSSDQGSIDDSIRQSDVRWLIHEEFPEDIATKIEDGINMASVDADWLHQWDYVEHHQYTTYRHRPEARVQGDFYTWHTDSGDSEQSDGGRYRKLSSTIQLSNPDDYEGGNFQWIEPKGMFDLLRNNETLQSVNVDDYIKTVPFSGKERGTLIVFPSFVHHQVKPVTRGTRISLVSWFHGHPYV